MTFASDVQPRHPDPATTIDPIDDPEWKWIPQVAPLEAGPVRNSTSVGSYSGVGGSGGGGYDGERGIGVGMGVGGIGRCLSTFSIAEEDEDEKGQAGNLPPFVDKDFTASHDPSPYTRDDSIFPSNANPLSAQGLFHHNSTLRSSDPDGFTSFPGPPPTNYIPPFSLSRHADLDLTRIPTNFTPTGHIFDAGPVYSPSVMGSTPSFRSKGTKAAKLTARAGTIWSMGGAFSEEIEPPKEYYNKSDKKRRGWGGGGGSSYAGSNCDGDRDGQPFMLPNKVLPRFVAPEDPSSMSRAQIMGWNYGRSEAARGVSLDVSVDTLTGGAKKVDLVKMGKGRNGFAVNSPRVGGNEWGVRTGAEPPTPRTQARSPLGRDGGHSFSPQDDDGERSTATSPFFAIALDSTAPLIEAKGNPDHKGKEGPDVQLRDGQWSTSVPGHMPTAPSPAEQTYATEDDQVRDKGWSIQGGESEPNAVVVVGRWAPPTTRYISERPEPFEGTNMAGVKEVTSKDLTTGGIEKRPKAQVDDGKWSTAISPFGASAPVEDKKIAIPEEQGKVESALTEKEDSARMSSPLTPTATPIMDPEPTRPVISPVKIHVSPVTKSTTAGPTPRSWIRPESRANPQGQAQIQAQIAPKLYHVADISFKLGGDVLKAGTIHLLGYGREIRSRGRWTMPMSGAASGGKNGLGLVVEDDNLCGAEVGAEKQENESVVSTIALIDGGDIQLSKVDSPPEDNGSPLNPPSSTFAVDPFAFLYTAAKHGTIVEDHSVAPAKSIKRRPSPTLSEQVERMKFDLIRCDVGSGGSGTCVRDENFDSDHGSESHAEGGKREKDQSASDLAIGVSKCGLRGNHAIDVRAKIPLKDILDAPVVDQNPSSKSISALALITNAKHPDPPPNSIPQTFPHSLHPDRTLISWIHVIPDAHPNFTSEHGYELWFHTASEVVYTDPRNFGRPIPIFGLEKGFVAPGLRDAGLTTMGYTGRLITGPARSVVLANKDGRRNTQSSKANNSVGVAGDMKVAYMGWWFIKSFTQIEPESQELLEMLSVKERMKNYGNTGRTVEAWHKGLSEQRWVRVNMEKYITATGAKQLVNPMETRWAIAIEQVEGPPRSSAAQGPHRSELTDKCKTGKDSKRSESSGSPGDEGAFSPSEHAKPTSLRPPRRFERIIGWENYVREVAEEANGAGGSP